MKRKKNRKKKLEEKLKNLIAWRKFLKEELKNCEYFFYLNRDMINVYDDDYDFNKRIEGMKGWRGRYFHTLKMLNGIKSEIEKIKERLEKWKR